MPRKELDDATKKRGLAFAKRIRESREKKGLSQGDLAKSVNISVDTLRALEQEKTLVPGVFLAADLVRELDGDLDDWIENSTSHSKSRRQKENT